MDIPNLDERTPENMEPFLCKNCDCFPDDKIGSSELHLCPKTGAKVFDDSDQHYFHACMVKLDPEIKKLLLVLIEAKVTPEEYSNACKALDRRDDE